MLLEALVGESSELGKAIHTLSNLNNDVATVNKRGKIVLLHDGVRDLLDMDAHAFINIEGCAEVDFFEIGSHESGTGC